MREELGAFERILLHGKMSRTSTQKDVAKDLLKEFLGQIVQDNECIDQDVISFLTQRIQQIDQLIAEQINEILHAPEFQKLESSWRGLNYFVSRTETSPKLQIRLLPITKEELFEDMIRTVDFDQSQLFKRIYEEEYGTFGGYPFSCFVGDFAFSRTVEDIALLEKVSAVAAASHAPFITAADPELFDMDSFEDLHVPRDLQKVFESVELIKWNIFRQSEDSRYVVLTLPRILMRLPYGKKTIEGFVFEEKVEGANNHHFCWANAAYALAQRITNAFHLYGWTAAIRGVEGGGVVDKLNSYTFQTFQGDNTMKCPTEVAITDRREKELSDLGFMPLCHCKGTDFAAFFGSQTLQKPGKYNTPEANANALISTQLPYVLASCRFAHYIKVIVRDKIGSFTNRESIEQYLNSWIANYVLLNDEASQNTKARYPLREARIDVFENQERPGSYKAVVYLRPHFQMEELTASLRLVATLPKPVR